MCKDGMSMVWLKRMQMEDCLGADSSSTFMFYVFTVKIRTQGKNPSRVTLGPTAGTSHQLLRQQKNQKHDVCASLWLLAKLPHSYRNILDYPSKDDSTGQAGNSPRDARGCNDHFLSGDGLGV